MDNKIKKINQFIKYTGSKRILAPEILSYFPKKIDIMIEPFCGSASLSLTMIANNWDVNKYIVSDNNIHVVNLLKLCQSQPFHLINTYEKFWNEFNSDKNNIIEKRKEIYLKKREQFNSYFKPEDFFCIIQTCVNGLIRFNSFGKFNVSCHFSRPGMNPKTISKYILENSQRLKNIEIKHQSYHEYIGNEGFFFIDPPYFESSSLYNGSFDHNNFFNWLKNVNSFAMTMDEGLNIEGLKHVDLKKLNSSHTQVTAGKVSYFSERLFLNY